MSSQQHEAEQALRDWAANRDRRDDLVRSARRAGVSKHRIHVLTGISRTTIDRILPKETPMDTEVIADQVIATLGDHPDDFDVAAIVEEIGDTYGRDVIRSVDDVPGDEYWAIVRKHERKNVVIWSVVEGASPAARAVEPGPAGVDIPADVLEWAEGHGLAVDNPDVYVLVTPVDEAGEVDGEIAHRRGEVAAEDMAAIREALDA